MRLDTITLKMICNLLLIFLYFLTVLVVVKINDLFKAWFVIGVLIVFSLMICLLFIASNKIKKHQKHIVVLGLVALALIGIFFCLSVDQDSLNFTCSMYHHELDFDLWWADYNASYQQYKISKADFMSFPVVNGISKIQGYFSGVSPDLVRVGDIISYEPDGYDFWVAHRVMYINRTSGSIGFTLMSDNGQVISHIEQNQVKGKFMFSPILNLISKDQCREKSFVVYCDNSMINQSVRENLELSTCCGQNNTMECVYDYAMQEKDVTACRYINDYWLRVTCESLAVEQS